MFKNKRLGKELTKLHDTLPPGIALVAAPDLNTWTMDISVLDPSHPIYANQIYRLRFRFSEKYPIEAPETFFVAVPPPPVELVQGQGHVNGNGKGKVEGGEERRIPLHPHIYSNGIVCLDLLGSGWSPVHNVESICVSLQSMLSGNYKAERPEGDDEFCRRTRPGMSTRGIGFVYDDDGV